MISKLNFRLAPPSPDEALHCLSSLLHSSSSSSDNNSAGGGVRPHSDMLSASSHYLKRARARTCWFRHAPYTLAVAALATAYNSVGLGKERRRLLRECDARARAVTGRGVDVHGVAACADAMVSDERAAAAATAAAAAAAATSGHARGSTESPVCGDNNTAAKDGWGSPTGVAQGAELLQKAAFSAVGVRGDQGIGGGGGGVPLVEDFSPLTTFSPHGAVTTKAVASHVVAGRRVVRRVSSSLRGGGAAAARPPRVSTSPWDIAAPPPPGRAGPEPRRVSTSPLDVERVAPRRAPAVAVQPYPDLPDASRRQSVGGGGGQKRRLHQSSGSCFVPCARRRRSVEGKDVRRVEVADAGGSVGGERVEEDAAGRGYHGGEYLQDNIAQGLDQRQQGGAQVPAARGRQQQQQQQREGGGLDSKPAGQQQPQTAAL